ncbi:hypothetical protein GKC29_27650 [Micromonospora sp. WMMC415]|uniref:hypothetical protein n=1 Tax=Micromonospora sp. WMMC415 TaxID=2675222 RepID=UPI0012B46F98|nr:hypothetical protein [Micromonospora sp. WMMC415]QGN50221.1 hypothetical protein GKC29_27650 [Micromonospora sp. WMMC415]
MSTKAVDVKKALRGYLAGMDLVTADNVQVTYGFPSRSPERKWAVVGEVSWEGSDWATNRARTEAFSVMVAFSVQVPGGTSEQTEAYAVALAAEFEDLLEIDPSIDGLCVTSSFTPRSLKSWPIDGAYECQYETVVRVTARP